MKRRATLAVAVLVAAVALGLVLLLRRDGRQPGADAPPQQPPRAEPRPRAPVSPPAEEPRVNLAVADLVAIGGSRVAGRLSFSAVGTGPGLQLRYSVRQLPFGEHGVYLHERGDCGSADGSSAGGYLPVGGGAATAEGSRLGTLRANVAGAARGSLVREDASMELLLDRSVLIEIAPEKGASLRAVACGVVQAR